MEEIANALAIALDAIEKHAGEITDPILAGWVSITRTALAELQLAALDRALN